MIENGCNVRVMDLGIATSDGISHGTLEGRGFGTYPYAPPEQIQGQRSQIKGTSDLYSLGITFYELLTGVNPFDGGSDVDIMVKQIKMALPYNDKIPMPLFKVLLKATAKVQSQRYQTANEFKDAIINANIPAPPVNWNLIVGVSVVVFIMLIIILVSIL